MTSKGMLIIAGASRGLGRTLALTALQQGYDVAAMARSADDLASLAGEASSDRLHTRTVDLTDAAEVRRTVQDLGGLGTIRGVIHCAATWTGGRAVMDLTASDYLRSFDLNFFSALHVIQAVIERHSAEGRGGDLAIIAAGATASLRGGKKSSAFATAKGALRAMLQSLAKELGPSGVHVAHVVLDGLIDNPRTRALNDGVSADRYMRPESIAHAMLGIVAQSRDAWTFELDMRPYNESW